MMVIKGAALIAIERQRQFDDEGWTAEHDDEHTEGELALAAACYATPNSERLWSNYDEEVPRDWPWERRWWKPSPDNRIRELIKAGALIAAEIERLERLPDNGATAQNQ